MTDFVKDPVCGMDVNPAQATAQAQHDGRTFFFCCSACRDTFMTDPGQYSH